MSGSTSRVGQEPKTLVVACGALASELRSVLRQLEPCGGSVSVEYLPAPLHNRPERIPDAVRALIERRRHDFDQIIVAYADCGTGGRLVQICEEFGATMLAGAHCYDVFAGAAVRAAINDDEPGTFFLTDFLAKHADALIFGALGIDRHPQLRDAYFGNYRQVCLLSQTEDPAVIERSRGVAERLGLAFVHRHTGLGPFAAQLAPLLRRAVPTRTAAAANLTSPTQEYP